MPIGSTRLMDGYVYFKVADVPNVPYTVNWLPLSVTDWATLLATQFAAVLSTPVASVKWLASVPSP